MYRALWRIYRALLRILGLFCEYYTYDVLRDRHIGIFFGNIGLFCGYIGLFCGYIGLFCESCTRDVLAIISDHDRFHCKCYTPKNHQIEKLKFFGTQSNQTKISIWICTASAEESEFFDSVDFGDVAMSVGIVIQRPIKETIFCKRDLELSYRSAVWEMCGEDPLKNR